MGFFTAVVVIVTATVVGLGAALFVTRVRAAAGLRNDDAGDRGSEFSGPCRSAIPEIPARSAVPEIPARSPRPRRINDDEGDRARSGQQRGSEGGMREPLEIGERPRRLPSESPGPYRSTIQPRRRNDDTIDRGRSGQHRGRRGEMLEPLEIGERPRRLPSESPRPYRSTIQPRRRNNDTIDCGRSGQRRGRGGGVLELSEGGERYRHLTSELEGPSRPAVHKKFRRPPRPGVVKKDGDRIAKYSEGIQSTKRIKRVTLDNVTSETDNSNSSVQRGLKPFTASDEEGRTSGVSLTVVSGAEPSRQQAHENDTEAWQDWDGESLRGFDPNRTSSSSSS